MTEATYLCTVNMNRGMNQIYNTAIVDDNQAFLEGLKSLLKGDSRLRVVVSCLSGLELIEYLKKHNIDLVLLDIEMPGLNGLDTAKYINLYYPGVKIIAITMYQDKVYLRQLIELGFNGFVSKTSVSEELDDVISAVLNNELCFPESIKV
jgi:DNA-binding NarL/FixJ family response regulator